MSAIAPNPNDPQAPLGMPARPWWIGYIRQLHLDIPLAVESGGTGKADTLNLSDLGAYKATIRTSAAAITAQENTVYRLIGSGSRTVNLPSASGVKIGAEVEIFIESPTITDVTITPAESEDLISQGGAVDYVFTGLGKSVRMIRVGQSQWNVIEPDVSLTAADIAETDALKIMTATERTKLTGIAEGANNYTHPATHPQSMIEGLATALAGKAPLASPALTGTPTAPTAAVGTNTTQIATTAFAAATAAQYQAKWTYSYSGVGGAISASAWTMHGFAASGTLTLPLASSVASGVQVGALVVKGGVELVITRSGSDQFVTPAGTQATTYTLRGNGSSIVLVRVTESAWACVGAPDSLINAAIAPLAPLASPALTGTPTAPTAEVGTNTTQLATTAFVQAKAEGALLKEGTPSGPTATGTKGMARFNADYFYVCTATNTWVRFAKDGSWT